MISKLDSTFTASLDQFSETGTISGPVMRYGLKIDRGYGMSVEFRPGAFAKQVKDPTRVKVLWQHDRTEPIGRVTGLEDTATELRMSGQIANDPDIPTALKALALVRGGFIDELSVGVDWGRYDIQRENDQLHYVMHTATLGEISLVTHGALGRGARVQTVASSGQTRSEQIELLRQSLQLN